MNNFAVYDYAQKAPGTKAVNGWATAEEIRPYGESAEADVILGKNASIAAHFKDRNFLYAVNNNVFCVGGSGSGKTRNFILSNLLNHSPQTYIITDTKGEISKFVIDGFMADGFEITTLDTINIAHSSHYDPLRYAESDEDILALSEQLFNGTRAGNQPTASDPFWDDVAKLLLRALIGILRDLERLDGALADNASSGNYKYLTMNNLLALTQLLCFSERSDGEGSSPLDYFVRFLASGGSELTRFPPLSNSYGIEQFQDFRIAAGPTLKSILITLNASFTKLRGKELQRLFADDETRFEELDRKKRVIILKMSDCDSSKSFLAQIALHQLIQQAFKTADKNRDGKLKMPIQFILDEFPNVGRIQDFPRVISTARSRNISFLLCAQSLTQLKSVYGFEHQIILDNCDSFVYMGGGSSIETSEYISRLCGEAKIGTELCGIERTERPVYSSVITPSDLRLLPRDKCIVLINGCKPFLTTKYDAYRHPNAGRFLTIPKAETPDLH